MRAQIIISFLFILFLSNSSFGQEGILFSDGSLNAILSIAQDRDKDVFIDTYADWCQPCKRMKKKFKDPSVARLFNDNFINYRVNMQNPTKANQLRRRYDIVFLPTMLIVDKNGTVKYQVDRELSVSELLNMGQKAINSSYASSEAPISNEVVSTSTTQTSSTNTTTSTSSSQKKETSSNTSLSAATRRAKLLDSYETVDESSQKVLAVLGAGELPPEVLLQEAYLRLEFMDGSHKQTAKNYLATQENWDTEINRKFILDFVNNVASPEYRFIVDNKETFINQFGPETIKKTLEIITYRALHNAVPRPSLEESIAMYSVLDVKEPNRQGYSYYINRLIAEDNAEEVLTIGNQYLDKSSNDHEFLYTVSRYLSNRIGRTEDQLNKASELMELAIQIDASSLVYLDLLGKIYSDQGKSNTAKKIYLKAIKEAEKQGKDPKIYEDKITSLDG